jgi:predicted transporter
MLSLSKAPKALNLSVRLILILIAIFILVFGKKKGGACLLACLKLEELNVNAYYGLISLALGSRRE